MKVQVVSTLAQPCGCVAGVRLAACQGWPGANNALVVLRSAWVDAALMTLLSM
jgi:hypothetical protein